MAATLAWKIYVCSFFKCPYTIHSGVYTYVFMYEEFKKSKSMALIQANVQKSKMAATLTWKIYV